MRLTRSWMRTHQVNSVKKHYEVFFALVASAGQDTLSLGCPPAIFYQAFDQLFLRDWFQIPLKGTKPNPRTSII